MLPEIFLSIKDFRKLETKGKRTRRESPQTRSRHADGLCWKQEPKGVITYTPKSDMTIHLGVVAGRGGGGADLLTVWLLTVSLGWLVRISHCVSALDAQQIKISTIADRQTLVELGFGFSFPFILKIWAQLTLPQSVELHRGDCSPKDETSLALRTVLETFNMKRIDLLFSWGFFVVCTFFLNHVCFQSTDTRKCFALKNTFCGCTGVSWEPFLMRVYFVLFF